MKKMFVCLFITCGFLGMSYSSSAQNGILDHAYSPAGATTIVLPMSGPNTTYIDDQTWEVAHHVLGLWQIYSTERFTFTETAILSIEHLGTYMEGFVVGDYEVDVLSGFGNNINKPTAQVEVHGILGITYQGVRVGKGIGNTSPTYTVPSP